MVIVNANVTCAAGGTCKKRPRAGKAASRVNTKKCVQKPKKKKMKTKRKKSTRVIDIPSISPTVKVPTHEAVALRERWVQCALCQKWRMIAKNIAQTYLYPDVPWFCWYDDKLAKLTGNILERACTATIEVFLNHPNSHSTSNCNIEVYIWSHVVYHTCNDIHLSYAYSMIRMTHFLADREH